jgi:hypothetical protein
MVLADRRGDDPSAAREEEYMNTRRLLSSFFLSVLGLAAASSAFALASRVFVSERSGNDANSCDKIKTPCRSFAGAVLQLNPGGVVIVLTSGDYGAVTITQSLTIDAPPGVLAFIHPASGIPVSIFAGASDTVVLRGLTLNSGASNGIEFASGGSLYVENCVISGFGLHGIASDSSNGKLFVKDTISRGNLNGLEASHSGRVSIDHCRFEGNEVDGVFVDGADVTVRDSVSAGNGATGFRAFNSGVFGNETILNVYQCLSSNNGSDGFFASNAGGSNTFVIARVANSSINENFKHGLNNVNAVAFESLGNNFVRGNIAGDISGIITVVPPR